MEGPGGTNEGGGAERWLRLPPSAFPFVLVGVALAGLAWLLLLPLLGLLALLRILALEAAAGIRHAAGPRRERRAHGP